GRVEFGSSGGCVVGLRSAERGLGGRSSGRLLTGLRVSQVGSGARVCGFGLGGRGEGRWAGEGEFFFVSWVLVGNGFDLGCWRVVLELGCRRRGVCVRRVGR